jgi:hypothetical protein
MLTHDLKFGLRILLRKPLLTCRSDCRLIYGDRFGAAARVAYVCEQRHGCVGLYRGRVDADRDRDAGVFFPGLQSNEGRSQRRAAA